MSLERVQQLNNRQNVSTARTSASLNPSQQPNDMTELLIKGAEQAAAGRQLGLSEEETLAAVSRQFRRQRRLDQNVTQEDVERQFVQAGNSLTDGPEIRGVGYEEMPEVDPFGESQDDFQNFTANDRGFTEDVDTGLLRRETFDESRGEQFDVAPASVLSDALARLKQGTETYGYDAFPGSAQVAGRLEEDMLSSGAEREAGRALVEEVVRQDSARFSPAVRAENDEYVANLASYLGKNFTAGGEGTMADEAIGRIGEVKSLGKVGETAQVIRYSGDTSAFPEATQNANGIYVDPRTGQPIAIQDTVPDALAGSNTPNTNNQLNAPTRESATEFVARKMPDYTQGGRVFGDYPQVDITGATTLFADRVRGLAAGGVEKASEMPDNIRSVEEFGKTIDMVREAGLAKGKKFYEMEQTDGGVKSVRTKNPGPEAVLNMLRYTPAEAEQLAGALYQLDAAKRSSVNQNPDSMYFTRTGPRGNMEGVMFDAAEAINPRDGQAQVAKFSRGERIEGKQISEAIRGLSPEAAMPFKGTIMERGDDGQMRETKSPIIRQTKVATSSSPGVKGPEYIRRMRDARGQNETPEDVTETRRLQVNNIVAEERAKRAAADRQQKETDIATRVGSPPSLRKTYGDGDAIRQVEDDARRQSEDMALSDLIRDIRRRRA